MFLSANATGKQISTTRFFRSKLPGAMMCLVHTLIIQTLDEQELKLFSKPNTVGIDRHPPGTYRVRRFLPYCSRTKQKKGVPEDFVRVVDELALYQPLTNDFSLVPIVDYPWIRDAFWIPARAFVARVHIEPNNIYAHIGCGIFCKNFFLHPPGTQHTDGSGRRKQQQQPGSSSVIIKALLEFLDGRKVS